MKRRLALCLALFSLLALLGCSAGKTKEAAVWFLDRYNALVTEMGYDGYVLSEGDLTVRGESFSGICISGLFRVEGKAERGVLQSLSITFTDGLLEYITTSENKEAAVLESLHTATMVVLALSEDYEILDSDYMESFLTETLVPSFTSAQRVGDYMLKSEFLDGAKSNCRLNLTLIG